MVGAGGSGGSSGPGNAGSAGSTSSALSISSPLILTVNKIKEKSTYEQLMDQVGFNHIPNTEIKTMNSVFSNLIKSFICKSATYR